MLNQGETIMMKLVISCIIILYVQFILGI